MKSPYILRSEAEISPHEKEYGNHFERNVYVKGEPMCPRVVTRYNKAASYCKSGMAVLDIGCSSGYGSQLLPEDIYYTGIDNDKKIIDLAFKNFGDANHRFICSDIQDYYFPIINHPYDVIIVFEFLEHVPFGIEFARFLKQVCNNTLICSVPYNETDLWGEHHVLHNLTEKDFPGFTYEFISFEGKLIPEPEYDDGSNLMLMTWRKS